MKREKKRVMKVKADEWSLERVEREMQRAKEKRDTLSRSLVEIHDKLEGLKKTLSIIGAEVSALEMVVRSYPNPYSEGSEYKAMALRDAEEDKK